MEEQEVWEQIEQKKSINEKINDREVEMFITEEVQYKEYMQNSKG